MLLIPLWLFGDGEDTLEVDEFGFRTH
jgi:hypothetical protein